LASFYSSEIFTLVIIPLLIFFARICDVTLDTARIIYVSRGMKLLAAFIGFFEVLIWLISITQIMQNLTNIIYYIAYAGVLPWETISVYIWKTEWPSVRL